jgi:hypothetical protein
MLCFAGSLATAHLGHIAYSFLWELACAGGYCAALGVGRTCKHSSDSWQSVDCRIGPWMLFRTPLLYPMLLYMVGAPSRHALEGSVWGYMTDPIFLSEPFLLALAAVYWLVRRKPAARIMKLATFGLVSGLVAFTAIFLLLLPALHSIITM